MFRLHGGSQEKEQQDRQQAEAERLAKERADSESKQREEAERQAKSKAEAERKEKEKAEAERLVKDKAEAERKQQAARLAEADIKQREQQAVSLALSSELAALFEKLSLGKYLSAFEEQEYLVSDLVNIKKKQLEKLIPAAGPRSRLEAWVKQQRSAGALLR